MNINGKVDLQSVFIKDPLYTEYVLSDISVEDALNILFCVKESSCDKTHSIDSFCPKCLKDTTFFSKDSDRQTFSNVSLSISSRSGGGFIKYLEDIGTFERIFYCPRALKDRNHDQTFLFKVLDGKIIKIGQLPSISDLATTDIEKYKKIDKDIYFELNRAIGLSAHGIGVGAFVYLRRIIEKYIVERKLQELTQAGQITVLDFENKRFSDKLMIIKSALPDFLINNPKIYSILSKGIHVLKEEECRSYFPLLRNAIEIILDEQIEQMEKINKNKKISQLLKDVK